MTENEDLGNAGAGGSLDPSNELRKRALIKAAEPTGNLPGPCNAEQTEFLLEELRIHQIELEVQNDELRRVQSDLEISRARYFDLYNLAPVGYVTVGMDGSIIEANVSAASLFCHSRSDLLSRKFTRYIAVESQDEYHLARVRLTKNGNPQNCEFKMLRNQGSSFWARLQMTTAVANDVQLFRIVIVDIDDQKRLDESLRQANERLTIEKSRAEAATSAKSRFLSSMSHEIRTPLNGVVGMAGLLLQSNLNSEQQSYAQIIASAGETLLLLVNDILDLSKIEAGCLQLEATAFDLECLIEEVLDVLAFKAREKSLEIACWYASSVPRQFVGDAARLRQVLMNFVSNAIKFTQRGYVLVEVQADEPVKGRCRVRIAIHDTGIGMSEQTVSRLFTRFEQADPSIARLYGGTGLGLSIVKQVVELMHGEVSVFSVEGKGSTFAANIPLQLGRASPPDTPGETGFLVHVSALVSGSHQITRSVIAEWCRCWGMKVVDHCELTHLAHHLKTASQRGSHYQVVIIDANAEALSDAVSEFETSVGMPIPKLVLVTSDSAERTKKFNADLVLALPVRFKTLGSVLGEILSPAKGSPRTSVSTAVISPQQAPTVAPFKLLVVDDNLINQKLASTLLRKLGYQVDAAHDGKEAVAKVISGHYDLIFMDCVMPGMDGFKATVAIRNLAAECSSVPIVALTASATSEDRQRCFRVGMNDFLTKPIRSAQLADCLAKWLKPAKQDFKGRN